MSTVAKKKSRLPSGIGQVRNLADLSSLHIKVMLEYLGVPLHLQGGGKQGRIPQLIERIAAEPQKAQLAYEIVVLGMLPDADRKIIEDADQLKAHFYGVMSKLLSSEESDKLGDSVEKHVIRTAEKLKKDLENYGKECLRAAAENYRPVVITNGSKQVKVRGVLPKEFETIVQLCAARIPTMLVGPSGCGKTYVSAKVAEALDLTFYDQSCSEGVSESVFVGWLLPIDPKSTAFTYVPSPYITAYEKGGVFLLDEMDASDPNLLTFLNKSIANEFFHLPQRHKNPLVKKHRDFVVIGAMNTFGRGADTEYVGRNALDAATLDRFRAGMIHMDYSAEVEEALVHSEVLTWGRKVRSCIYQHKLRRIMSTRVMLDLTKMANGYKWGVEQWERSYFADWTKDEVMRWRVQA